VTQTNYMRPMDSELLHYYVLGRVSVLFLNYENKFTLCTYNVRVPSRWPQRRKHTFILLSMERKK
jgi:hypothetical protein